MAKKTEVDIGNIQGSIWPRLPKYYEAFLFFKIMDTDVFKTHLRSIAGKITTGAQCREYFLEIDDLPQSTPGKPRTDIPPERRKPFEAVNISFSYKGIEKLVMQRRGDKLDDELHIRGMYKDMVFEGPDDPNLLADEYKPPKGHPADNDQWRVDGLLIVTAQTKDKLDEKVEEVKRSFGLGTPSSSIEIAYEKHGNLRNADGKAKKAQDGTFSLHGKEHFGFEDEISQPQIRGLDPEPGNGHQRNIPPGLIFTGLDGDKAKHPDWATEGSFLVFREIVQKVPEFDKFMRESSKQIPSFDDGTGEKLAAYLMGRWKNGSPVELDPDGTKPEYIFADNFDYAKGHTLLKNTKCPFAAHIRKMRPRADLYVDTKHTEDEEEIAANEQVSNTNLIIRRGITFGPEVDEVEEAEETKHKRGIYFLCYQSDIRNGFNMLIARWASNRTFAPNTGVEGGPGVDPIISQRSHPEHPEGYVSIYDQPTDERPYKLPLSFVSWTDQRGGEYFFTPSISALKTKLSEE
ncbi:Dyp-type peroxidase [Aspergillus stella-maris]|uniref:Dyp-type peroxidase n=1 Tax=Aspergillus stella-maris TaxID=1810926 RepID=UPI003CCDB732